MAESSSAHRTVADERIEDIVEAKRYWIYRKLAEWRDLNATRVLREYRNGEGFLYLGRSYRLLLVADQEESLLLQDGRFCLRRDLVDRGEIPAAQAAFRDYYIALGQERLTQRVQYYAPKVGVTPSGSQSENSAIAGLPAPQTAIWPSIGNA